MNTEEQSLSEKTRLTELLAQMDVPSMRRLLNEVNLMWLNRNLAIRNHVHPAFTEADGLVKKLLGKDCRDFFE